MKKQEIKDEIFFLLLKIVIVVGLVAVLVVFVFGIYRNKDDSMKPALKNGDLVFYYRLQKEFMPQEVVVLEKNGEKQIRRIIAKEGDLVDITEEGLMINGYLQQEPEIYEETYSFQEGIRFPITVGKDEYFVLGDRRTNAKDSRFYGTVKQEEIKGNLITVLRRRGF